VTGSLFPFASVGRLPGNSSPLLHVKVSSSHVEALKDEQHQLATELQGMTKNQLNAWSTREKKKRLDALASFFTHFSATVADDEIKLSTPVDSAQAQALVSRLRSARAQKRSSTPTYERSNASPPKAYGLTKPPCGRTRSTKSLFP
jgi:hypothetical protein